MTDVVLKGDFFRSARGLKFADGGGVTWAFDAATNTLSIASGGGGVTDHGALTGLADDDHTQYALDTDFASGVYTPTLTNVANLDGSTALECQYLRVGNTVTVSGKVSVDPTAPAAETRLGISLPIASNLGAEEDCAGTAHASGIATQGAGIRGDITNNRAEMVFISADVTNQAMYFTFSYQVI